MAALSHSRKHVTGLAFGVIKDPYGLLGAQPPKEEELLALMVEATAQSGVGWGFYGEAETLKKPAEDKKTKTAVVSAAAHKGQKMRTGALKTGRLKVPRAQMETCAPSAEGTPMTDNVCPACSATMCVQDLEYKCEGCGILIAGDFRLCDDDAATKYLPARLRIVGANAGKQQPDLDRSSCYNSETAQRKQILDEFIALNQAHVEQGGRAFPMNALEKAADNYHTIQKVVCKRSLNKRSIEAACLRMACASINFAPDKAEFASMMQLKTNGIARGENFVRMMKSEGYIDLDVNQDMCRPNIMTVFSLLGLGDEKYEPLHRAVEEVVNVASKEFIGTSSNLRSKVMGAAYVVLRRHALAAKKEPMSLQHFCDRCKIRRSTIERFTGPLNEYHSYFVETYQQFGLDETAP